MRLKKIILLFEIIVFVCSSQQLNAQNYYWIGFSDKNGSEYSLATPGNYLSERAVQRRLKQNIPIDSFDLPVNKAYINAILQLDVELVHVSKWLNGMTVKSNADAVEVHLSELPFVKELELTKPAAITKSVKNKFELNPDDNCWAVDSSFYGNSVSQVAQLNGQYFHNQDFKGQGMHIAILDGGFFNVDTYEAFDSLRAHNQILGTKDFVDSGEAIFDTHYHGMSVLSCIGGNVPGQLIGTAPKASFWLLRSEDTRSEYKIEEDNWVVAAEFADSVGADIINSSLGYSTFDDASTNHSYADMDGKTTRVTQAANIAASRGMLVFASAGNEGNKTWKYIIAPADGDGVIGVGAVNEAGEPAYFSSFGPASDFDVKPNVAALGWNTWLQKSNGTFGYANGTSFSAPVLAGMAACLWQMAPEKTAKEVKEAIELSAHLYHAPDSILGYGIPDMFKAAQLLFNHWPPSGQSANNWFVYPNPIKNFIILDNKDTDLQSETNIRLFSMDGKLYKKWVRKCSSRIILTDLPTLPAGIVLLMIETENGLETQKLITIN